MPFYFHLEFVCGCVFVIAFMGLVISVYQWTRAVPQAEGCVRCIEKHKGIDGVKYSPIVEFIWEGEVITLENLPKSWSPPKVKPGESVPIYFEGWEPTHARLTRVSVPLASISALGLLLSTLYLAYVGHHPTSASASRDAPSHVSVGENLNRSRS